MIPFQTIASMLLAYTILRSFQWFFSATVIAITFHSFCFHDHAFGVMRRLFAMNCWPMALPTLAHGKSRWSLSRTRKQQRLERSEAVREKPRSLGC